MSARTTMAEHSTSVEWRFVVPPHNTRRIVVTQRQDGPFRKDSVGAAGHYYTSVEVLDGKIDGMWLHLPGSSSGGHSSFESAMNVAGGIWHAAVTKASGSTA